MPKSSRITRTESTLAPRCKRLYDVTQSEKLSGLSSRGIATFPYSLCRPNSPPSKLPPFPPLCPLKASPSIHSRRKSLSFISSTSVSLVCSCASCLLKANRVGILVIYRDSSTSLSSDHGSMIKPSSYHAPCICFAVSIHKDYAFNS